MPDSPVKPVFEIVTTTAGAISIRNNEVNETMHNPVGPWVEANALYITPSRLVERLQQNLQDEFVIFDVGLGAAANVLAALHAWAGITGPKRNLRIVSFERDLSLLRFALNHAKHFDHFKGFESAIETLLVDNRFSAPGLEWVLRAGDFLELLPSEQSRAHLIFFDPYSPKKNQEMWTTKSFRAILDRCDQAEGALLMTYSRATPIRVSLLDAGFFLGAGTGIGLKDETTQAATNKALLSKLIGHEFLERWSRSQSPLPYGNDASELPHLRERIARHPQFA